MDLEFFRNSIRSKLKEKKLTLNMLSDLSDLSEDTLRSVIYGKSKDIKLSTIIKIADVFHCSIDELVNHKIYSHKKAKLFKQINNLPERSVKFIQIIVSLEEKSQLNPSTKGMITIPTINFKGSLMNGMFYNGINIDYLDISEYPLPLQRSVSFGLRLQTTFYEPIFYQNDILLFTVKRQPGYDDILLISSEFGELYILKYTQMGLEPINGFGKVIRNEELNKFTRLGIFIKTVQEFDIEQYR